ncbi:hypothetical protein Cgig2_009788 [Carnegiea gigantea]|uniref:Uncharacterized protein n=1 Tax=Carnegiea gigantea TaxID=171969 RepID=A0A9Q1JQB5_9CARY|nr:hypothetical protein Cgig2_009788 [Carnegiea gigantea]
MEAANSARPRPHFDYIPTHRGEPSHRQERIPSPRYTKRGREIASATVVRILIDMGSSVDIITWDCLKTLAHPVLDIIPLVHPILGFDGQEVNPMRMNLLPVRFANKLKSKNPEVVLNILRRLYGEAQFGGIIYNHGVNDCRHHLREVGIVGISPHHLKVKTGAKAMVVRGKRPGARARGILQRPS